MCGTSLAVGQVHPTSWEITQIGFLHYQVLSTKKIVRVLDEEVTRTAFPVEKKIYLAGVLFHV